MPSVQPSRTTSRATLFCVKRNITLSLPEEDLRQARIVAARRGTSVSRMLADTLKDLIERETGYSAARERHLQAMSAEWDLGTEGDTRWSRAELHDR
jgi:hypothetical protein